MTQQKHGSEHAQTPLEIVKALVTQSIRNYLNQPYLEPSSPGILGRKRARTLLAQLNNAATPEELQQHLTDFIYSSHGNNDKTSLRFYLINSLVPLSSNNVVHHDIVLWQYKLGCQLKMIQPIKPSTTVSPSNKNTENKQTKDANESANTDTKDNQTKTTSSDNNKSATVNFVSQFYKIENLLLKTQGMIPPYKFNELVLSWNDYKTQHAQLTPDNIKQDLEIFITLIMRARDEARINRALGDSYQGDEEIPQMQIQNRWI